MYNINVFTVVFPLIFPDTVVIPLATNCHKFLALFSFIFISTQTFFCHLIQSTWFWSLVCVPFRMFHHWVCFRVSLWSSSFRVKPDDVCLWYICAFSNLLCVLMCGSWYPWSQALYQLFVKGDILDKSFLHPHLFILFIFHSTSFEHLNIFEH